MEEELAIETTRLQGGKFKPKEKIIYGSTAEAPIHGLHEHNFTTQCLPFMDILRLAVICFTCFILITIVGYQSLLPILLNEGIFNSLCDHGIQDNNPDTISTPTCDAQKLQLDMMFNFSISALNAAFLFWGMLCFKYGPKPGVIIGGILVGTSPFIFSFGYDWPCFFAYIMMGIGYGGVLFGVLQVPTEYPHIQGFLFSLMFGFIDLSASVFYIFLMVYEHFNVSMRVLFITLSICSTVSVFMVYFFVYSSRFDGTQTTTTKMEEVSESFVNINVNTHGQDNPEIEPFDEARNLLKASTLFILKSPEFINLTAWTMFFVTTTWFYITTMDKQIAWMTDGNEEQILLSQQVFSVMLLSSGIYSYFTGLIMDKGGMKFAVIVTGLLLLSANICSIIPVYNLQWLTMIFFVFYRVCFRAMTPLLIAVLFGIEKQQMLYGIVQFISGSFNLLGFALDDLVVYDLNGNYTIINVLTGIILSVVGYLLYSKLRNNKNVT